VRGASIESREERLSACNHANASHEWVRGPIQNSKFRSDRLD
jgi:hypothetical protein